MAKSGAQAPAEKPEAQKGSVTKMPIFLTKFDGSGSDNTDEFRRTLMLGHIELQGTAASFYKARGRTQLLGHAALRAANGRRCWAHVPAHDFPVTALALAYRANWLY